MAEEIKQEEKRKCSCKGLSIFFKLVLGFVFLGLGASAIFCWWLDLLVVFKGCIGLFLLLAGVVTLAIAKE